MEFKIVSKLKFSLCLKVKTIPDSPKLRVVASTETPVAKIQRQSLRDVDTQPTEALTKW